MRYVVTILILLISSVCFSADDLIYEDHPTDYGCIIITGHEEDLIRFMENFYAQRMFTSPLNTVSLKYMLSRSIKSIKEYKRITFVTGTHDPEEIRKIFERYQKNNVG